MMATMIPKRPKADPKISIMSILTKVEGVWESERAQPAPETPTHTPQNRLERPTESPAPKMAKDLESCCKGERRKLPGRRYHCRYRLGILSLTGQQLHSFSFPE